jgi:hypothetical protein
MKTYIYALKDPRTDEVRYVGKTAHLRIRYNQHVNITQLKKRRRTHLSNWIFLLESLGLKPTLQILEETEKDNWVELERKWIKHFTNLCNSTEGGEGLLGFKHSDDTKQRISQIKKGKCTTSDYQRSVLSRVHKGKITSESTKQKMRGKRGKNSRSKRILCIEDNLAFNSVEEAALFYSVSRNSIHNILSGISKKLRKGKTFIYEH